MLYLSTRGEAPPLSFVDALLAGLARDGGLYLPQSWPNLSHDQIAAFAGQPYEVVAGSVMAPFIGGEISGPDLESILIKAYAGFRSPAIAPLVQIDANLFVLELFHGPTLAFKDLAMQVLGRMMDHVLRQKGERATIIGATSGDTGAAAIEAFAGLSQVDVFILYPHGRVSEVQRRQMTTCTQPNVHTIALEGTFDDCQTIVKGLFNHHAFRDRHRLSGVNSINWARVMAQAAYYFTSAVALGGPHRPVSFAVPTGNFGDVLAGDIARHMGLPVKNLVIATNANDILARAFADGHYTLAQVRATQSPSMDIQISSNFERLLFEAIGRDAPALRGLMAGLKQSGSFTIPADALAQMRTGFAADSVSEAETTNEIAYTYAQCGMVIDPHTAVGMRAARKALKADPSVPMVVLATAHPAKFPDAVEKAIGQCPGLPEHLSDLFGRPERQTLVPNDQTAVEKFIAAHAGHA